MKLISKIHGEIEYEENEVLTFNKGIPGYVSLKRFILTNLKDYKPFKLFHSIEDDEIGMIVVSPYEFYENYEVKLKDDTIDNLGIKSPKEVMIITTVTLNSDPKKITTNLQGPIVINTVNNKGEQIIIDSLKYKIKEPLIKE